MFPVRALMRSALLRIATLAAAIAAVLAAVAPGAALVSRSQVSIIQDSTRMLSDPAGTMSTFRALGVRTVRIIVVWAQIAPDFRSRTPPAGFNASDPAAYPEENWAPYDRMVELAEQDGIAVDLTLSGGAPRWAEGPGKPPPAGARQPVLGRGGPRRGTSASSPALPPSATAARMCPPGTDDGAAPGELLGDLERAELRRGPRTAGDRRG